MLSLERDDNKSKACDLMSRELFTVGQVLGKFWMSLLAGVIIRYFRSHWVMNLKF